MRPAPQTGPASPRLELGIALPPAAAQIPACPWPPSHRPGRAKRWRPALDGRHGEARCGSYVPVMRRVANLLDHDGDLLDHGARCGLWASRSHDASWVVNLASVRAATLYRSRAV